MNKADRQFLNWVFEAAVVIGLAALAGRWLDVRFAAGAQYLCLFLLLGFGSEGYNLYKIIKSMQDK